MTIGLLSFEYPPETGFGGIGTYTWYQARALAKLGHAVHVIAGAAKEAPLYTVEDEGVLVHRYHRGGVVMNAFAQAARLKCHWTRQRLENAWSMYGALAILKRRYRFDVLEMPECGAEGCLITSWSKTPAVVRFHSPSRLIMPFYDTPRADQMMCSLLERRAIRRATALTSCSQFLADEVRIVMGVRKPVSVIPNGIDLSLFDRTPRLDVAAKYGIPSGKPIIFFAGRMERRKGIHLCHAIVKEILQRYDVSFVFAGGDLFGYMTEELLPALRDTSPSSSVHYVGKLDLPELRSWVRTADVVMLPSLWENCPYTCLEAMAAARSIVCSDQGGMPELIEDGRTGLLACTDKPQSFVEQIGALIENEDLRFELGAEARKSVEARCSDDRIAGLSVAVYEQCLQRSVRPKPARRAAQDMYSRTRNV